ncbi:MAG: hypothetical protein AKCLJLPJ_00405 [Fimbriimonadales bacterium]|nr:hypothetical protein [Fimbriimonadales bacterium]
MSRTFDQAIEMASKLPEKDRDALGALLIREMQSEKRWAKLLKGSQDKLSKLADEALKEHKAGKTKPWQ